MARHNMILGRDAAFTGERGYAGFNAGTRPDDRQQYGYPGPAAPGGQNAPGDGRYGAPADARWGSPAPASADPYASDAPQDLEAIYARPSATGYDTGRMTMGMALNAITATLGTIIVVGLAVMLAPLAISAVTGQDARELSLVIGSLALVPGMIGGLVLGLVNSFKKRPSAVLTLAYAAFEGLLLGGLSATMEYVYPGIAMQAIGATFAVAGTVFVLFRLGVLRTSPKLNKIAAVAMIAYMVFLLANLVIGLFTGSVIYSGMLGLVIGAVAVLLCSYMLVSDLEDVQNGVRNGVPREYAWRCAFGLAATLVWMYIEMLRILAILRGD